MALEWTEGVSTAYLYSGNIRVGMVYNSDNVVQGSLTNFTGQNKYKFEGGTMEAGKKIIEIWYHDWLKEAGLKVDEDNG